MENNELDEFQLLIEQGVVSNEQKATTANIAQT